MNKLNVILKSISLVPLAVLTMGNQSCDKPPPRYEGLKKIVHMGSVRSPSMQLPGGQVFDFGFVANQQIYGVLMDNAIFALKHREYVQPNLRTGGGTFRLTASDYKSLDQVIPHHLDPSTGGLVVSKEAACMVNLPMARMEASVNAFELIGGGGLRVGFTPQGGHSPNGITDASLGFNIEFAQLDVSMRATNPITGNPMAAANVDARQTKTRVNASVSLGMFSLGPSFFYQTPLARVTKSGLTKAVEALGSDFEKFEWYTRVMYQLDDKEVFIVGGQDLGLEQGDELLLFNEEYLWDGEPCASTYRGGGSSRPVAILRLEWAGDEVSKGFLIKQDHENVRVGAKVRVYKRKKDAEARTDINISHLTEIRR